MSVKERNFESILARAIAQRGVLLMGVCNVTPDSFSDGGEHPDPNRARGHVDALLAEGADIVDIGGESTRPGAPPVPPAEQLARVLEVVRYASERAVVSIDTQSPEVAEACLRAGARIINDVSCLRDPRLAEVGAHHGATLFLMHSRGPQEKMRGFSDYPESGYGDVVSEVLSEWRAAADTARGRGLQSLVMDPGLGFAKNARQSFELLRCTARLAREAGVPVLVGASRKSFLKLADPDASATERLGASVAAAVFAARAGAQIVRVHDVRATRQAIDLFRGLDA